MQSGHSQYTNNKPEFLLQFYLNKHINLGKNDI